MLSFCAGGENRTPVLCLEGRHSTTKLHPQLNRRDTNRCIRIDQWGNFTARDIFLKRERIGLEKLLYSKAVKELTKDLLVTIKGNKIGLIFNNKHKLWYLPEAISPKNSQLIGTFSAPAHRAPNTTIIATCYRDDKAKDSSLVYKKLHDTKDISDIAKVVIENL